MKRMTSPEGPQQGLVKTVKIGTLLLMEMGKGDSDVVAPNPVVTGAS